MLRGKHFLVTGVSSGIGQAVTGNLLEYGVDVTGIARRSVAFPSRDQDDACHGDFQLIRCDVSEFGKLARCMTTLMRETDHLDGMVLCHGYGDFGCIEEFSDLRIRQLVDTNLTSNLIICRYVVPRLKATGGGDIILIGSEAGLRGSRMGSVYCAAKFGVNGFAESLRDECAASGVRVCAVNPGMVDSAFFDSLDFCPGDSADNHIMPGTVAEVVRMILTMPSKTVIDTIKMTPQKRVVRKKHVQGEPASHGDTDV